MKNNGAIWLGNSIVGRAECNDDCAHFRVDIAEDVRDALAIELDGAMRVGFVEAQVKAFSVKERKDIVKKRIEIRQIDTTAGWYDQHVRTEFLVFLNKRVLHRVMGWSCGWVFLRRGEPDHGVRGREV